LAQQWQVTKVIRRGGLGGELLDSLASPETATRVAAAKLCGALRLAESVAWLSDLLSDPDEKVRIAAARPLGRSGRRRAVGGLPGPGHDRRPSGRGRASEPRSRSGFCGFGGSDPRTSALPSRRAESPDMKLSERFDRRYQQTPLAVPVPPGAQPPSAPAAPAPAPAATTAH